MDAIDLTAERHGVFGGAQVATCPYETDSRNYCAASIMTVVTNSYQKRNYCWTDNYDCCPLFLSKVLRER